MLRLHSARCAVHSLLVCSPFHKLYRPSRLSLQMVSTLIEPCEISIPINLHYKSCMFHSSALVSTHKGFTTGNALAHASCILTSLFAHERCHAESRYPSCNHDRSCSFMQGAMPSHPSLQVRPVNLRVRCNVFPLGRLKCRGWLVQIGHECIR